ncbi:Predicted metalloprotease [Kingella potus]|uniref:Predicted metalloprotease n=1 Tax=Kingella potus TaxID=265175 RepID=A0A377QYJ7_9NEIS|nr:neutral zinc metallopeptidase [Kingella potus]UOP01809.1 zinc metallopeptidase [Kingella potus]STQ99875.1 Predicted metalloprotease [Kingella potus]
MRWQGRERSSNIEDRRGSGGGGGGGGMGIVGLIVVLVGAYYGVDLSGIVGTPQLGGGGTQQVQISSKEEAQLEELSAVVLADTEKTWSEYFARQNARYTPTTLVLYTGGTHTGCGTGQAAMGPFYCPADKKVYLDLSFYEEMRSKLGAAGDTAFGYVIAHEVGHHVQNLLGILPQVHQMQQQVGKTEANRLSVKLELQADCFAGVWAKYAQRQDLLEAGDIEEAVRAAEAVGDDTLQKRSKGYAVPDSFTHGSSAQRMYWLKRGLESGDIKQCDTFAAD